jgi:hypothetical protein
MKQRRSYERPSERKTREKSEAIRRPVAHEKEDQMKMTFAVLALCACMQGALAAGPDCRAIDSTTGRLACYDAAYPRPKIEKPAAVEGDRTAYKDPFLAEDARTRSKLNNICRGC